MEKQEIFKRRDTKVVTVGGIKIGGLNPISIQSMTKTDTRDAKATLNQIFRLKENDCEIIRIAIPDEEAADSLADIVKDSPMPVISDIHFDYKLALKSVAAGVAGLRLNPGNIKEADKVKEIVAAARDAAIPIRIGVNGGSLPKDLVESVHKGEMTQPEAMVAAANRHIEILEELKFYDIKISLKASNVPNTVKAYRLMAQQSHYPFHVGITESGTLKGGIIKSSIGIGILIADGICDTLRVSLTSDPVEEVILAKRILETFGLRKSFVEFISCPTCGRVSIDLQKIAAEIEALVENVKVPLHIAVMGCEVNGPGEAREADLGIAGGKGCGVIFKKGEIIKKVPEAEIIPEMEKEIKKHIEEAGRK